VYDGFTSANIDPFKVKRPLRVSPKQHPRNMNDKDSYIISYKPPVKPLVPRLSIAPEAVSLFSPNFENPRGAKFMETILIGPANSGK
jgi:hypothetical protein